MGNTTPNQTSIGRVSRANQRSAAGILLVGGYGSVGQRIADLMAKACVQAMSAPNCSLNIHLLIGLGDRHGCAALTWMVDRFWQPYMFREESSFRRVWAFQERSAAVFPKPYGHRSPYRFDFSDQHTLVHTLSAASASTWCTFDRSWVAFALHALAKSRLLRLLRLSRVRELTVRILAACRFGSDQFAISVQADSIDRGQRVRWHATGFGEAQATAVLTSAVALRLLRDPRQPAVWHLDQRYDLNEFLDTLAEHGITVSPDLTDESQELLRITNLPLGVVAPRTTRKSR